MMQGTGTSPSTLFTQALGCNGSVTDGSRSPIGTAHTRAGRGLPPQRWAEGLANLPAMQAQKCTGRAGKLSVEKIHQILYDNF